MIAKVRLKINSLPEYIWHCWLIDRDCVCTLGSSFYITFCHPSKFGFSFCIIFCYSCCTYLSLWLFLFLAYTVSFKREFLIVSTWLLDIFQSTITWTFLITRPVKTSFKDCSRWSVDIVKILNLYIILLCTLMYHFFPISIHYLQCFHCLLNYIWRNILNDNKYWFASFLTIRLKP